MELHATAQIITINVSGELSYLQSWPLCNTERSDRSETMLLNADSFSSIRNRTSIVDPADPDDVRLSHADVSEQVQ